MATQVRPKIFTRSSLNRRTTVIIPITKEETKENPNASFDIADEMGYTQLHKAVMTKQYSTCSLLLSKGVDINKPAAYGMTALLLAARHGDLNGVQVLLTSDQCDINARDKSGWTALHHCAVNNHLDIAEMLLVLSADPWAAGNKGEVPFDVAPMPEMQELLSIFMKNQNMFFKEEIKKCAIIPRKGEIFKSDILGIQLEVPRPALGSSLFFICRRIPTACSSVELGQSEVMLSDVYDFWPPNITFEAPVTIQIDCMPTNEMEEIVLKVDDSIEVPLFKEKQPYTFYVKKAVQLTQTAAEEPCETARKFSITRLGRLYVVSRLPKETYKVFLIGTKIQHSNEPGLSITVPKNGLNSEALVSLQLYPVASDLVRQMQKQYPQIVSMGPICEVTHTDTEAMTRRLVTMTVPLPEEYITKKQDGRLVVVGGTADDNQPPEIIEKSFVLENGVEFLTRFLTWKVALLVRNIDQDVLSEVSQTARKYTRKRMHFISYLIMYKVDNTLNLMTVMFMVVDSNQEAQSLSDLTKQGYNQGKILRKQSSYMLCEGEVSYLFFNDDRRTALSVAYFHKQLSRRSINFSFKKEIIKFKVSSANNILAEGEICV